MDERAEREHIQLLLKVARWYYLDDVGQAEIARRVGYSRSRVSRLLTEAKDRKMVRFVVGHPLERHMTLERELQERFGLRAVRVAGATSPQAVQSGSDSLARAGADVLVQACRDATVLATSAGTTIDAVVQVLPHLALRDLQVVQMIGALTRANPLVDSPEIARRIAERLGATYRQMPAPLIVKSARLAADLKREEAVATAIALASHADVALVGVGAMDERGASGPIFSGWLSRADSEHLVRLGAVGHVFGHHFDAQGRHVHSDLCERIMSIPLERRSSIKTVIGVAAGEHKVSAIRGAVLGGHLDVLVTDSVTAQAVLSAA